MLTIHCNACNTACGLVNSVYIIHVDSEETGTLIDYFAQCTLFLPHFSTEARKYNRVINI